MKNSNTNSRFIQFAGGTIKFSIEDSKLLEAVDVHFAHCLGGEENVVAEYQVRAESASSPQGEPGEDGEARFAILRNGESFQSNISFERVLFQLMQDGLGQLNGVPTSSLVLHAAGLAYQDRGLILGGKSGSGKSTLAAWLASSGFQYLTDEVLAYPAAGGEVSGFCRSLVLKRGSSKIWERWLNEQNSNGYHKMEDGSVWVTPTLLNPSAVRKQVEPRLVLFPSYNEKTDFTIEKLTLAGTVFMTMQCFVNARNFPDHGMAAVKEFSSKVAAYRLIYSDIDQATEWIQQTLEA